VEATFSKDLSSIILDVGGVVNLVDQTLASTSSLCEILFEAEIFDSLGGIKGVRCNVVSG
jgi:hypothetical protein